MTEISDRPVLVVGATGNLGRLVVDELLRRGIAVRAMTRNISSPSAAFLSNAAKDVSADGAFELIEGDVTNFASVLDAMQGCHACVSCHGARRFTNPVKDLLFKIWDPTNEFLGAWGPSKPDPFPKEWGGDFSWLDPAVDPAHPWNTAYYGVRGRRPAAFLPTRVSREREKRELSRRPSRTPSDPPQWSS